jgi:hypothetical protein
MPSHINQCLLEGHLVTAPAKQEDGSVLATLQNHEEWTDDNHQPQSRDNMLGLRAIGRMASKLLTFPGGTHLLVLAKAETAQMPPGPRGGTQTKTKFRVVNLSRPS